MSRLATLGAPGTRRRKEGTKINQKLNRMSLLLLTFRSHLILVFSKKKRKEKKKKQQQQQCLCQNVLDNFRVEIKGKDPLQIATKLKI